MIKPMTKALIAAGLLSASVVAQAGLSANLGAMSDYWFRGFDQAGADGGASISGGLDYEHESGVYVGTWLASLPGDVEYDLYAGYAGSAGDLGYSIGFTGFYYDEFDGDFEEINLGLSYGPISLSHNIGEFDDGAGFKEDYTFTSITGEYEGAYLTYGAYGDEADGDYFELGYGLTYEGLDMAVAYITGDDEGSAWVTDSNTITFTFGKSFDL
ncbi:MAG: TorF family putative porin [Neptuniibacter sp.]